MKKLAVYIFTVLLFYSCSDKENPRPIYPVEKSKKHTVLLYLGIDNNFSREIDKIETLCNNWSRDYDANLLVYGDVGSGAVLVNIHSDMYGESVADTIELYPRENSASPEVFSRVLKKVYDGWPATQNGLIVLSHGSGWMRSGKLQYPNSRAIINDKGENHDLDLWDFAGNIPKRLDYIIFDDCLLAGVEVMSELQGKTKYAVACPAEIIVDYIKYEPMMSYLVGGEEPDLRGVIDDTYTRALATAHPYLTMSLIDIDKFKTMEEFCRNAFNGIDIESLIDVRELQQFFPLHDTYTDLGDIVKNVRPDLYSQFRNILQDCVPYSVNTPKFYSGFTGASYPINAFSGLTMYVQQSRYAGLNEDYKILKWYKAVYE